MGMNEEELNKLQEVINDQLDLIEMNVARINNKDYFGLDFELLKYIRNLENQLDIANNKLKEVKEYLSNYKEPLYIPDDLLDELSQLKQENNELKQQLQAYKAKEEKLKDYCNRELGISLEYEDKLYRLRLESRQKLAKEFLQILNEGDK